MIQAQRDPMFWILLREVQALGRRSVIFETLECGGVADYARKGMTRDDDKSPDEWGRVIKEELLAAYQETGEILSAAKLRERMGGKYTGPNVKLQFDDPRFKKLGDKAFLLLTQIAMRARWRLERSF